MSGEGETAVEPRLVADERTAVAAARAVARLDAATQKAVLDAAAKAEKRG